MSTHSNGLYGTLLTL